MNTIELIEEEIGTTTIDDLLGKRLVVFNDSVNSFEHVIDCFVKYLKHTPQQSEQLAMIIHNKGKAIVKEGPEEELKPLKEALDDAGLTCEIQ